MEILILAIIVGIIANGIAEQDTKKTSCDNGDHKFYVIERHGAAPFSDVIEHKPIESCANCGILNKNYKRLILEYRNRPRGKRI